MWAEFIYAILRALLPWLSSGETKTTTTHAVCIPGMDRARLPGTGGLSLRDLPKLLVALALLSLLSGCMGTIETRKVVLCEPGSVCEIATDKQIDVLPPGETVTAKKNMAGCVAMPKSVYREMRAAWIAQNPEAKE